MDLSALRERLHALLATAWPARFGSSTADSESSQPVYTLEDLPGWDNLAERGPSLPPGYWSIFAPSPLSDTNEIFVQREEAGAAIESALARWRSHQATAIALVGLDASGRTSFLNHLQQQLANGLPVTRVSLAQRLRSPAQLIELLAEHFGLDPAHENIDSLTRAINQQPRRMLMLDDAQYLVLRSLGNAAVIKTFLAILLATQGSCLWLVSMKEHAWHRLDHLYGIGRYFSDVIRLPYFSREQFTAALQARIRKGGLPLRLPGSEDQQPIPAEELDEATAQQLFTLSGGNLLAALFYWHWCTHYDADTGQLEIQPFRRINPDIANGLDRIYLFTLAEMLVHGDISAQDHAEIFHCEIMESRLMLDYLCARRFVDRRTSVSDSQHTLYGIAPIFYLPIANALQAAHVMY